jgi:hypothetical protein
MRQQPQVAGGRQLVGELGRSVQCDLRVQPPLLFELLAKLAEIEGVVLRLQENADFLLDVILVPPS